MATIDSLTFDLTDCSLREQSETHRGWVNSHCIGHVLRFAHGRIKWPFDLTNPSAAHDFYARQCDDNGGVMLAMEAVAVTGAEALSGLFKYRSPLPNNLGMFYVGILWLPFDQCSFQINVEAFEQGITGTREAAVMLIARDEWPELDQKDMPVIHNRGELQELYRKARVRRLPSDEPRYDHMFPKHPLSLVRARLAEVIATARLDKDAQCAKPFRVNK